MPGQTNAPRLFIQTDPANPHANIARWVEVNLTNEFVSRVKILHGLLGQHRLQLVTAEFDTHWCLGEGWQVSNDFGVPDTWLDVWSDGFTIRSRITRIDEPKGRNATTLNAEAAYMWGTIDEFVAEFHPELMCEPFDRLATSQGWSDYVPGEPDWEIAFGSQVNAHLNEIGERPLQMHQQISF
jgi:hypothetical protein